MSYESRIERLGPERRTIFKQLVAERVAGPSNDVGSPNVAAEAFAHRSTDKNFERDICNDIARGISDEMEIGRRALAIVRDYVSLWISDHEIEVRFAKLKAKAA